MASVVVEAVNKRFGNVEAVKDISFEVQPGEIFGLLGPNGAGKTTTIRMLLDIFKPDSGRIEILGGRMDTGRKHRIGYLPEERGLYKDLPVDQTLIFLATLKGLSEADARKRLDPWLERMDLSAHRHKKTQELSKGMQQKAQLIATLLHNPDLLVIDEPFSGLDPVNTRLVKEIIEELRSQGKTILMCTHQMHQVEALCSRIVLINRGKVMLYGNVNEIRRQHASNSVLISGHGDFTHAPQVAEAAPLNGSQNGDWRLTLKPGASSQALFQALARMPGVCIDRFEVSEASLDDIFVSIVQQEGEAP
jgi:ABC-2 type transport system ATP-binding protein